MRVLSVAGYERCEKRLRDKGAEHGECMTDADRGRVNAMEEGHG